MDILPSKTDLASCNNLGDLLTLLGVSTSLWKALTDVMGDPGGDTRQVAALTKWAITQAIGSVQVAPSRGASVVQAAQLGLVWRSARKMVFLKAGGDETQFVDVDPWEPSGSGTTPAAARPAQAAVKESVLKMAALVDQTDESELLPPDNAQVQAWLQRYSLLMGGPPEEEEEPTAAQLAGLHKRVVVLKQAPYVDFGVWVPFGRRALKQQKFRVYTPLGDGSFLMREMPGPQNLLQWQACWKVLKTAALMLGIISLTALLNYEKTIERLVVQWPAAWGLICQAEDKARAERLEKIRRNFTAEAAQGKAVPADWGADAPWTACMQALARDESFWSEQVRHPAVSWLAAGGRGVPIAAAEAIAGAHFPGSELSGGGATSSADMERRKQANRDKRTAKKKRIQDQRDELQKLKSARKTERTEGQQKKGGGKGETKDQSGLQLCFSWASGAGPCADVPAGGDCKCQVKRVHKCQFCLSPSHRNDSCPLK